MCDLLSGRLGGMDLLFTPVCTRMIVLLFVSIMLEVLGCLCHAMGAAVVVRFGRFFEVLVLLCFGRFEVRGTALRDLLCDLLCRCYVMSSLVPTTRLTADRFVCEVLILSILRRLRRGTAVVGILNRYFN